MNGKIWVQSEYGSGSEFHFAIPVVVPEEGPQSERPELLEISALVVQGHAPTRRMIAAALERWGTKVRTCGSLAEAVSVIRDARDTGDPIHLAIVDIQLPDGSGMSLPDLLRRQLESLPAMVLVIPCVSKFADSAHYSDRGFQACISRPVRTRELREAVNTVAQALLWPGSIPSSSKQVSKTMGPVNGHSLNILLVEDNPINQRLSTRLLEKRGSHRSYRGRWIRGPDQDQPPAF